jgi:hypothetical protein
MVAAEDAARWRRAEAKQEETGVESKANRNTYPMIVYAFPM